MRHITQAQIEEAYSKLSKDDKLYIDRMCATLENNVVARAALSGQTDVVKFGRLEALELLAKVGMWMREEGE